MNIFNLGSPASPAPPSAVALTGWQAVKWGLSGWVDLSVELRRLGIVQAFGRVLPVVPAYQ